MNIILIVFKNRKNSKIRKELYFYEYHFKIEKIVKLEKSYIFMNIILK